MFAETAGIPRSCLRFRPLARMIVAQKTSLQGAIGVVGWKFGGRVRRLAASAFASSLLALIAPAIAAHAEAIKLGSITAANVGPVYVAVAKGYFAAEGLQVELVSFDAAQPVAVAVASGAIDF